MSLTDVAPGEVTGRPGQHHGHGPEALTAGSRALFAAVSGLLLIAGISVVLWAITPHAVGGPAQSLRAGVTAFAAGNAMTVTIGRAALTLPPLMITIIAVALLAGISGRGRAVPDDRMGESTRTVVAAAVYAAVVTVAGVVLGTPGAIAAEQWWRPFLLALVVVGTAVFFRGEAWRAVVLARTPRWFPVAVRLGAAGAAGVVAAGALALVLGLAGSFGNSGAVQTLAAPGPAAGFGMALLGIAYLPNAVVSGAGYVTGVGFHIGGGTYSPFGSSPVELPAISLLAAAPDGREASRVGLVLLLVPVVVALLVGRAAVRRLEARRERLSAVGAAAAVAGLLVALLAVVAGGGITGGQWASIGAPPLSLGVVTALIVGVFGALVAALARQPAVQTSAQGSADADVVDAAAVDGQDSADEGPPDPTDEFPVADEAAGTDRADTADTGTAGTDTAVIGTTDADTTNDTTDTDTTDIDTADTTDADTADTDTADTTDADTADSDSAGDTTNATSSADRGVGTVATGGNTVPQARREDDVLVESGRPADPNSSTAAAAAADAETTADIDPSEPVRSDAGPRHVG